MTSDGMQRGTRAKKEDYIVMVVKQHGKIKVPALYGELTRRFQGIALRTFLTEYLTALEYREEIVLNVEATGYFAYTPEKFVEMRDEGKKR